MFRRLAYVSGDAGSIFTAHPIELVDYLETVWARRADATLISVPRPNLLASPSPFVEYAITEEPQEWNQLIYAYMIENTRVYEIFERVLRIYLSGEKLGIASQFAQLWIRNTEMLFYRHSEFDSIYTTTSDVRPDARAVRRNAYFRMFGMDLNHGTAENKPYPFSKPGAANRDFVTIFEALLREVWVGIKNVGNASGANPTDRGAIANHASRLSSMLLDRRQQGNLSREEFMAVAVTSWLHLALEIDSPIVQSLNATATSAFERIRKIGERVDLAAHGKSEDYFRLADPMSRVLRALETGNFNTADNAPLLYEGVLRPDFYTIITHWSSATGRNMKVAGTETSAESRAA